MKKFSLVMLALALVLGFTLVSCKGGEDYSNAPIITQFITGADTGPNGSFDPTSSFTTSQYVYLGVRFTALHQPVVKDKLTIKKDGDLWRVQTDVSTGPNGSFPVPAGESRNWTGWRIGSFPAGSYTIEYYIEDIDGKKSETATANFTIVAAQ